MEEKYTIHIEKPDRKNEYAVLHFSKNYGDMHGGCMGVETKEKLIKYCKQIIKDWESFDSIVQRIGDKVKPNNIDFKCFDETLLLIDIMNTNQKKLF